MAIDDIVGRILADAQAEADAIVAEAEADGERVRQEAAASSEAEAARTRARERARAQNEAATLLANARLNARDTALTARLALAQEALDRAEAALVALPDAEYAALIARGVAQAGAAASSVALGVDDAQRLRAHLPGALEAAGYDISLDKEPAPVARGVVVSGAGVRVEVSPAALVAARRAELLALADRMLSGREA